MVRSSTIVVIILCTTSMLLVTVSVAPHFIRVVSKRHGILISTQQKRTKHKKIRPITPAELRRVVLHCNKDTVLVHFWNTWSDDGTLAWRELRRFAERAHNSIAVIHVCTDMNGIQQMKASGIIAEEIALVGPVYGIRAKASLFDLHNDGATRQFYESLTGSSNTRISPSVLALNKHGLPMRFDGLRAYMFDDHR